MYFFSKWGEERSCLLEMKVCTSASDAHVNKVRVGKHKHRTYRLKTGSTSDGRLLFMRMLKKRKSHHRSWYWIFCVGQRYLLKKTIPVSSGHRCFFELQIYFHLNCKSSVLEGQISRFKPTHCFKQMANFKSLQLNKVKQFVIIHRIDFQQLWRIQCILLTAVFNLFSCPF